MAPAMTGALLAAETNSIPACAHSNVISHASYTGDFLDRFHDFTYQTVHQSCEKVDRWGIRHGIQPEPMPPTRLRLGLYGKFSDPCDGNPSIDPQVSSSIDVRVPNIEKRLKLFITTIDPTKLPGVGIRDENNVLRFGLSRSWFRIIDTSVGVKARWQPKVYAKATVTTVWSNGLWKIYPYQRGYWENDDGFGEITSIIADRWINRWDFRAVSAVKWSESKSESDNIATNDAGGWQWEQTFTIGYARELLDERDYGRLANSSDLARGGGVRISFLGGPSSFDIFRIACFYKVPIHSRWLYFVVTSEVEQQKSHDWDPEYRIKTGIEALFWGTKER